MYNKLQRMCLIVCIEKKFMPTKWISTLRVIQPNHEQYYKPSYFCLHSQFSLKKFVSLY
jgi:hypothetical protein